MKALITGAAGFVGNHLARLLLGEGIEVWGTVLDDREKMNEDIAAKIKLLHCDLRDSAQIRRLFKEGYPDYIFHLAAQSNVAKSWDNPTETYEINVMGTVRLLDEIVRSGSKPKTLLIGSAEEYGKVSPDSIPIMETTPLDPVNPYGSSKAAVSMLFQQYYVRFGLPVVYTRSFNHIGPGQSPGFVTVDFARQIAEIEAGKSEPVIKVGNLEARRDFTDVRDVVRAYWSLIKEGTPGEVYNVATGMAPAINEILDILLQKADVKIEVVKDMARMRPSDVPVFIGDNNKLKLKTGWQPAILLEKSLNDILNYWRQKTQN